MALHYMSDLHPEFFGNNLDAARLIDDLCFGAHIWDDLIDRDKEVSGEDINKVFMLALLSIPNNPFFLDHRVNLAPLIHAGVMGFITANVMEKSGDPHQIEIAHGLRYAIGHVAAYAIFVCNPQEEALRILPLAWKAFMPERIGAYVKEHVS